MLPGMFDRHTRKRVTSRISNFIWSTVMTVGLLVLGWYIITAWVMPWLGAMDSTI